MLSKQKKSRINNIQVNLEESFSEESEGDKTKVEGGKENNKKKTTKSTWVFAMREKTRMKITYFQNNFSKY